ncbi:ABCC4 (predicted) [Pycnogonum litorale]
MGTRKGYTRLVETERKCVIKHSDNGLQKMRFVAASGTSDQDSVDKARGKKILREKHLIDEANILSITFFAWTYQILKNGFYKTVSHMQSSLPPEEYTSLNISKEFRRRSEQVGRTALTATGLLKIIILINFKEMCTSLILCMIQEWLLKLGPVLMIGTLLRQLKSEHIDTKREIQLATAICIMFILKVFTGQHSLFLSRRSGIKARSALTSLIYEKAMRISHPGFQKTSPGQILNLITNDINDFDIKFPYLNYIIIVPVQTVIVSAIIWREFSPWSLFGLIIFLLIIIIQSSVGKLLMKLRHLRLKASDERIHLMTDILMNMKTVKMYGWEDSFSNVLSSYRKIECRNVRKTLLMKAITTGFMRVSVKLLMLLIFLIYFFQGSRNITSDKLFVLVTLCYSVRYSIPIFFPTAVAGASEMYSSLKRIQNFLSIEEHQHKKPVVETENPEISIVNASASWNIHNRILTDISFNVKGNKLITVVGPVGSGKTSFLMMVLKELELLEGIIDVKGSIAYVPQEAWLFSDTIRNNILFGRKFYSERFENIVDICGLRIDMESFPYGAESLVGERGIILSGGQRTRVSLAR